MYKYMHMFFVPDEDEEDGMVLKEGLWHHYLKYCHFLKASKFSLCG